jgi:hypothetical protein
MPSDLAPSALGQPLAGGDEDRAVGVIDWNVLRPVLEFPQEFLPAFGSSSPRYFETVGIVAFEEIE